MAKNQDLRFEPIALEHGIAGSVAPVTSTILRAVACRKLQCGDETGVRALKKANALVREIGLAVQPPQDIPIVLTEDPGAMPNWVAAAGIMEAALTGKFSEKVAELRKTDPLGQKIEAVEKTGILSRSGVASSGGVAYDL